MRVQWTEEARQDRLGIIRYIAKDNPNAAKHMDMLLRQSAKSLLRFPLKGRIGRVEATRELVVHTSYILIYELEGNTIRILSVAHAAQQYPLLSSTN